MAWPPNVVRPRVAYPLFPTLSTGLGKETEISAILWVLWLGNDFMLFTYILLLFTVTSVGCCCIWTKLTSLWLLNDRYQSVWCIWWGAV